MVHESAIAVVEEIFTAPGAGAAVAPAAEAYAEPGRGLRGDRYFVRAGTFGKPLESAGADPVNAEPANADPGRDVTIIEAEVLELARSEFAMDLSQGRHRRNIVVRGIRLDELIGREFRLGAAQLRGVRRCPPCAYLASLNGEVVMKALHDRGGLRCDVVRGGLIRPGDAIEPL